MHTHSLDCWRHPHQFLGRHHDRNERRTWLVGLTAVMMVTEIIGGTIYGSMALVADGWHMSTHAGAPSRRSPIASHAVTPLIHALPSGPVRSANWRDIRAPSFWLSSPC